MDLEKPKTTTRPTPYRQGYPQAHRRDGQHQGRLGAPRIHGELLKLGITVCERTVQRYMPKLNAPPGSRQRWQTFLHNHLHESLAIDFAVVPTITFDIIYVFFVLSVDRRRILHFNVTRHPSAKWTAQQVVEAYPFEPPGRFLFRDNDKIYGTYFKDRVEGLGLTQVTTAFRSPWQNPYAERWIGGLRRDCLDHVIALNEDQLRRSSGPTSTISVRTGLTWG